MNEIYEKPFLQKFCTNLVGRYNKVLIFNLEEKKKNFHLPKRRVKEIYYCDAETTSSNQEFFVNSADSSLFQFGSTQSNDDAHNGNYSSKLNELSPYGMTVYLEKLSLGESIEVSVWRKTDTITSSNLVISSEEYYNTLYKIEEKDSNGWEKLTSKIFVSDKLANKNLSIYVYNPDKKSVYFDDLTIIRYENIIKQELN